MEGTGAPVINSGLEGIYFTETKICKVDGANGRLWYRGYSIESLAKNSSFEEVSYLLLYGELPKKGDLEDFRAKLFEGMSLPDSIIGLIKEFSGKMAPIDILRTSISALPSYDKGVYQNEDTANKERSINIIAKASAITAAIGAINSGKDYIKPKQGLSVPENLLYMMYGQEKEAKKAKMLDAMMLLHAEHGSNASTFSTIVAGSTLADIYSAITAGIAALKGPLHGGADDKVLSMVKAIGTPDNTEKYIEDALANRQKIMGFGHRVYKTYDPRAKIIKAYLDDILNGADEQAKNLAAIALRAEKLMIDKLGNSKGVWPNIDLFSGLVYSYIGIPQELFTPIFAAGRAPGWCAHMLEYWKNNRLIRPLDYYTGQIDTPYVPIEQRK